MKSLLLEAYVKGQQELLYVVPFVAKVLESSLRSMVFRPQNPWTMAIMNVLAELHQEHDLKVRRFLWAVGGAGMVAYHQEPLPLLCFSAAAQPEV